MISKSTGRHHFKKRFRTISKDMTPGAGNTGNHETSVEVFDYNSTIFKEYLYKDDVIKQYEKLPSIGQGMTRWVNIDGKIDIDMIEKLCKPYNIDSLVMKNILNTGHRPKLEEYDDYIYIIAKMIYFDGTELVDEQLSIILGKDFVISFGERKGDVFNNIREQIRKNGIHVRKSGTDYLVYTMIDSIAEGYDVVLERFGEQIDDVEEEFLTDPTKEGLIKMRFLKRDLLFLHKSIWPLREVINNLERNEKDFIKGQTRFYLRDIYDHVVQTLDMTETYRELLAGLMDIYLSSVSNKLNEIMKVLTIISTIFIPVTFLVGLYGMNFKYMPELYWKWGYAAVLALIAATIIAMILYFKHKKWF